MTLRTLAFLLMTFGPAICCAALMIRDKGLIGGIAGFLLGGAMGWLVFASAYLVSFPVIRLVLAAGVLFTEGRREAWEFLLYGDWWVEEDDESPSMKDTKPTR